jgi:hypothetical protein
MTIDHHIARVIGAGSRLRAIHCGNNGAKVKPESAHTFATGPDQPILHIGSPNLLRSRLLGLTGGAPASTPSGMTGPNPSEKALLDSVRDDIRRLRLELAGSERARLDSYLEIVDDFDRKQAVAQQAPANCQQVPAASEANAAQATESLFRLSTLALRCGITNVFGMSLGHGDGHDDLALFAPVMDGAHVVKDGRPVATKQAFELAVAVRGALVAQPHQP